MFLIQFVASLSNHGTVSRVIWAWKQTPESNTHSGSLRQWMVGFIDKEMEGMCMKTSVE
jgi:hypothetical protein